MAFSRGLASNTALVGIFVLATGLESYAWGYALAAMLADVFS